MSADRNLTHLYPEFAKKFSVIIQELEHYISVHYPTKGYRIILTEGLRSAEYQRKLWRKGRSEPGTRVTNLDGYFRRSKHQYGMAADIAIIQGNKVVWDEFGIWSYYGHLCRKHGFEWGGDWTSLVDRPHCEWKRKDRKAYAAAWKWLKENNLR